MKTKDVIYFLHSKTLNGDGTPKAPTKTLNKGEIAFNIASGAETLFWVDSDGKQKSLPFKRSINDDTLLNVNNHVNVKNNPHKVNKNQIGLDKVDNVSDRDREVTKAEQQALEPKISKSDVFSGDFIKATDAELEGKVMSAMSGQSLMSTMIAFKNRDLTEITNRITACEKNV